MESFEVISTVSEPSGGVSFHYRLKSEALGFNETEISCVFIVDIVGKNIKIPMKPEIKITNEGNIYVLDLKCHDFCFPDTVKIDEAANFGTITLLCDKTSLNIPTNCFLKENRVCFESYTPF